MKRINPRRKLKKEIAQLQQYINALPRLIDCSNVYGDCSMTDEDLVAAKNELAVLKKRLEEKDYENL